MRPEAAKRQPQAASAPQSLAPSSSHTAQKPVPAKPRQWLRVVAIGAVLLLAGVSLPHYATTVVHTPATQPAAGSVQPLEVLSVATGAAAQPQVSESSPAAPPAAPSPAGRVTLSLRTLREHVQTDAGPKPIAPYKPTKDGTTYDCDFGPVLFVNNFVEGLGNWWLSWTGMLFMADILGRAIVEPCMHSTGGVACSYNRLVDDPDPAVGYMRAYEQQQSGAVPKHVFPFSYYFKLRGAFTNKVRVIPYRQFISCAVAAQQATDQGKPAPARAGPPTERLRVATALLHHKTCELYRYEKPDTQSEFAVSDDVEFQRCAKIDSVSAELRPGEALNATSWLSTVEDQVLVFADVWNRYAQFGYPLPHLAKRHEVVKISDFHMDAVRRFAGFLQKNGHITVPDDTDPLRAVTVFHWRSETVSFGDNHMLLKCAAALGGAARQFLDLLGDSHHKEHGIIMSDLPTRGVMEKWLSYIGKDGREERLLGLPTLKKGASGRLLDYSDHFQELLTSEKQRSADGKVGLTAAAIAVDIGVVTVRELALALFARDFVSCQNRECAKCCRTGSAFVNLITSQRRDYARGAAAHKYKCYDYSSMEPFRRSYPFQDKFVNVDVDAAVRHAAAIKGPDSILPPQ